MFDFFVRDHVSPHLNSANDIGEKKLQKISDARRKRAGANRQQPVWMIASLEERQVHFSQVPFTAFMFRTVYFIYFLFIGPPPRALLLPNWYSNTNLRDSNFSLFYSFSDFVMVNTQVGVFNLEMNVYCRVSVSFSMMYSLSASADVCTIYYVVTFYSLTLLCFKIFITRTALLLQRIR